MSFIHPQSCECASSQLDLFAVPPTQTAIDSCSYADAHPVSSINDNTPIEFCVSGSGLEYLDVSSTLLYVKAKIVNADGTNLADDAQVGPINLLHHSLFSQVDVKLNESLISSTNNTYAYRSYIETLLSYGKGAKDSQLGSALYFKDESSKFDDRNPRDAAANSGLKKRTAFFGESKVVDMIGRLHSDIFQQDKYIPSEVDLRVRLIRNSDAFCLMATGDALAFKIKIMDCRLFVRKVKLSPSVYMAHAKALEVGTAKYPLRRVVTKTFTVPAGNLDWVHEGIFTGQCPTRIVLGCVDNDAFNGTHRKNPFNFKHYDMKSIKLYMDGQEKNIRHIHTNYNNDNYILAYQSLFAATGRLHADEDLDISRGEFKNGNALYCYDLTSDLAPSDSHFSLVKNASVRCELNFGTALPTAINVIVMGEFENMLEIDKNRNVIYDYAT